MLVVVERRPVVAGRIQAAAVGRTLRLNGDGDAAGGAAAVARTQLCCAAEAAYKVDNQGQCMDYMDNSF